MGAVLFPRHLLVPDGARGGPHTPAGRVVHRPLREVEVEGPHHRQIVDPSVRPQGLDLDVWALDVKFDSTIDGKAVKIASIIDEHTGESLLHVVERSISAERLVAELHLVFAAAGGPPEVLRMRNGPELVSQALQQFCDGKVGLSYIAGPPRSKGIVENSAATSNPIW